MPAERVATPASRHDRHVLYLHGGAFATGFPALYRDMTWRIATLCRAQVTCVDYRLAPEHPFPAGLDDCVTAYRWLIASGADPARIAVMGDSAGGGLVFSTLLRLRDEGIPLPAAAVAVSPWTDLALTGESLRLNADVDPLIPVEAAPRAIDLYLAGADPRNPYASPLYGDPTGLPPTLILVGGDDVLRDDAVRMAERMQAAGCDADRGGVARHVARLAHAGAGLAGRTRGRRPHRRVRGATAGARVRPRPPAPARASPPDRVDLWNSQDPMAAGRIPMSLRAVIAAAVLGLFVAGPATAQTYPDRPVKIIVPIGPAGSYDILGRLVADQLTRRLSQTFVVENRPGGGTIVGTRSVIAAPPDGYTLLVGGLSNIVFNAGLYRNLPYDRCKDLVPVALVLNISYTLVGAPTCLQTAAKSSRPPRRGPDHHAGQCRHRHRAAHSGRRLPVDHRHQDAGGAISRLVIGLPRSAVWPGRPVLRTRRRLLPYVKSGQAKGIAILAKNRNGDIPDVPTMTEAGVDGLEIDSWIGIFAPAKTPPAVIALLQKHIAEAAPR